MDLPIGHSVLNCKPILSHDQALLYGDISRMAKSAGSTGYRDEFMQRVFSAREHAGISQEAMAKALGISQATYGKYETRSLLPHRHIWTFCLACQITVEWLVTGLGKGVALRERPEAAHRPGRKKRPSRAA